MRDLFPATTPERLFGCLESRISKAIATVTPVGPEPEERSEAGIAEISAGIGGKVIRVISTRALALKTALTRTSPFDRTYYRRISESKLLRGMLE